MACATCGRQGTCAECCCISGDHVRPLPNLTTCRVCHHPARPGAETVPTGKRRATT